MENFYKKKSLGQNFLKDNKVLVKIADAAKIINGETLLEIGPGEGTLTKELLLRGAQVIAVEKDNRLIPILEQKFLKEISSGKLTIVHSDILDFSPIAYQLLPRDYKLVANIPYYITGEILRKALSEWPQPSKIVLLVQKEVAKRIVAADKKESLLSISVKIYGVPKIVGLVRAGSFVPAPKVDSSIIAIENISKDNFKKNDEKKFFEVAKAGFAHKRKKLSGNLKPIFGEKIKNQLIACEIPINARPENLDTKKWLCLVSAYKA